MAHRLVISNAKIVNEDTVLNGNILVEDDFIAEVAINGVNSQSFPSIDDEFDAEGKFVFPGFIDTHVHFREPGLTHKADIFTESRAAAAGGVTSFMEMPNTKPTATTAVAIDEKFAIAKKKSLINYSFFAGATNDNLEELMRLDYNKVCGVKVFMGSSTGNMLVDNDNVLKKIFTDIPVNIAVHCEDEAIIKAETERFKSMYGLDAPAYIHEHVRNAKACYESTQKAVQLAKQCGTKLHVTHISTRRELELFDGNTSLINKKITAEAVVPHLWFDSDDYNKMGTLIKCNPSIKSRRDRNSIRKALVSNIIDSVATDHAPHTLDEKNQPYFLAPSGMPTIQFASTIMFELCKQGIITPQIMALKMSHAPAIIFGVKKRGFIRPGYYADFAVIDSHKNQVITDKKVISKCSWTPFNGLKFSSKVAATIVNGKIVYKYGKIHENLCAKQLNFNR